MTGQRSRSKTLISCITVIVAIALGHGLSTSDARTLPRTTFLSPQQQLTPRAWLPIVMNNFPPVPTISRYLANTNTVSYSFLYNLGYSRGQATSAGQNVVIILDFGYPDYDPATGQYGATLLVDRTFHSTSDILYAVEGFLSGFYAGSPAGAHLTLAIGVNNNGAGVTGPHGAAWAQTVNGLNSWISIPPSYADKLAVWGAIDAELPWNNAQVTRAWVDGYQSTYAFGSFYLNFGSCDGCPVAMCPSPDHSVGYGWTCDDIWYVSYGATPAYPMPEIYLTSGINAAQWYGMSLYAYSNHGARMNFRGSVTQWNACQEQTDPNACIYPVRTDNMPAQGYLQLYNAINADWRTAATMPWSTDMSWQK